jgi:hypothetical protein
VSILTRPQNSTFTGSRDERGTRVNIGWFAIKGAETRGARGGGRTIQKDSVNIRTHDSLSGAAVLFYKCLQKEFPMETQTYSVQKNLNIYWSVVEEATGREAVVNGFVMDMLTAEEAEELAGALNRDEEQAFLLVA